MSDEARKIVGLVLKAVVPGSSDWGERTYSNEDEAVKLVDIEIAALREENARLREDWVLSEQQVRNKFGDAMSFKRRAEKAESENERLRASLGLYANPHMAWEQDRGADAREALGIASARIARALLARKPAEERGPEAGE